MTESAVRYKAALNALVEWQVTSESLAVALSSSTSDPKIRVAIQCFTSWCVVLGQKSIIFFTQRFGNHTIRDYIHDDIVSCVLFDPAVLYAFELHHYEYMFTSFVIGARLWDAAEKTIREIWNDNRKSWRQLYELLTVRTPTTRFMVGKAAVNVFLLMVPIVNEDMFSALMLPGVAAMFYAVLNLSAELADPWGEGLHALPLEMVLKFVSLPSWCEGDIETIQDSIAWLNRGLKTGNWTYEGTNPIPRPKNTEPNRGANIDFNRMRALPGVAGCSSWESFMRAKQQELNYAMQAGRRLARYVLWRQSEPVRGLGEPIRA